VWIHLHQDEYQNLLKGVQNEAIEQPDTALMKQELLLLSISRDRGNRTVIVAVACWVAAK
jgi:hypothetical protein